MPPNPVGDLRPLGSTAGFDRRNRLLEESECAAAMVPDFECLQDDGTESRAGILLILLAIVGEAAFVVWLFFH